MARGVFPRLGRKLKEAREKREAATRHIAYWTGRLKALGDHPNRRNALEDARHQETEPQAAVTHLETQYAHAKETLRGVSQAYHPHDLTTGAERTVASLGVERRSGLDRLQNLATETRPWRTGAEIHPPRAPPGTGHGVHPGVCADVHRHATQ